jgi:hypothetical protein
MYLLSDDPYSDNSESNSSSFHEVHVSEFNEPQNVDVTTERERKPKSIERKRAVKSYWKRNKIKL